MKHAPAITALAAAALLGATLSLTGCQETVVRESYAPSTGIMPSPSYQRATGQPVTTPAKKQGLIEGVGDFMFGWVDDVFASKPKPPAQPAQSAHNPKYDPIWVRMGE